MQGNYIRRIIIVIAMFAIIGISSISAAGVYNWTGEKDIGNWPGLSSYEDGWSEWSTSVPSGVAMYVKAAVYLPVASWTEEGCSTTWKNTITLGDFVRKERNKYTETVGRDADITHTSCDTVSTRRATSGSGYCKTVWHGDSSGYCSSNSSGACTNATQNNSGNCEKNTDTGQIHQCYFYIGYSYTSWTEKGSCHSGDYSTSNNGNGCSSRTQYCYNTSSNFKSVNDKSNWRTSLSAADGYGQKVYVYSYPKRVYVEYNGNGATGICGSGDAASWTAGSNSYNSNSSIKYEFGNPVCTTEFTSKSMSSASNSNDTTYFDYSGTGNLKENEYYKIGYDFAGWNTKADGSGQSFTDKEQITAATFQSGGKLSTIRAGETFTLYAQWTIHTYNVTFSYLCGSMDTITYQYGTGSDDLAELNISSCESGANTKFLGWFEDTTYTQKIEKIPATYYKDLTLYAKERQVRYFNYQSGKWVYTSDTEIEEIREENKKIQEENK